MNWQTNEPLVIAELESILELAEAGDESCLTRLTTLRHGRPGSRAPQHQGLSRHDADRADYLVGAALRRSRGQQ